MNYRYFILGEDFAIGFDDYGALVKHLLKMYDDTKDMEKLLTNIQVQGITVAQTVELHDALLELAYNNN